jgi:WhiB family transcriptional regulator, redox-sensing transcriptional regulator
MTRHGAHRKPFGGTVHGGNGRLIDVFAVLAPPVPAEDLSWQDQALCAEVDPDLHFPEKGESSREAKQVCRGCEVRAECLQAALDRNERFGVWGGLSERERRRLRRAAPQASSPQPRKAVA